MKLLDLPHETVLASINYLPLPSKILLFATSKVLPEVLRPSQVMAKSPLSRMGYWLLPLRGADDLRTRCDTIHSLEMLDTPCTCSYDLDRYDAICAALGV